MGNVAEEQNANQSPPRRGLVWAVTVDNTARAYDLSKIALGNYTPEGSQAKDNNVYVFLQAETADIYFLFSQATFADLDNTVSQAAGTAPVAYANTYPAVLKFGNPPIKLRLSRPTDRFLQLKCATSGVLRMWAASDAR